MAKKKKRKALTERRRRALVRRVLSTQENYPSLYAAGVIHDQSRATLMRVVILYSKPYAVAAKLAEADARDAPNLNEMGGLQYWRDAAADHLKIVQADGTTVWVTIEGVAEVGADWEQHADYLLYEDIRRMNAWRGREIYEVTLQEGRHCHTCKRTHFPREKDKELGRFYGENRNVSGLNAAIPEGYYVTSAKGVE